MSRNLVRALVRHPDAPAQQWRPEGTAANTWVAPWSHQTITHLDRTVHAAGWDSLLIDPDCIDGRADIDDLIAFHYQLVRERYDRALQLGRPIHYGRRVLLMLGALPHTSPRMHQLGVIACHGAPAGIHLGVDRQLHEHTSTVFHRYITSMYTGASTRSVRAS
ncbi:hypothetical protein [Nocardia altamirensis]|uniref:hypothetical protein n=1 Tax=Nocardia altamirensis TaxID=472158 RepID=UPI0008400F87|nr:hypothetical protein [Nocardia altamirensis]